ncbi:hypothetical protein [Chelatococcus asaccharovorans]|uniref:hypothetical protein n=1 Tax=Chelatococcus asaccharovorans TaxID=28210 RepID=UPI00224C79C1|nr:hypothetical protein [Chelatococcus asaccharovorans]CAH1656991.1 hypothetical protein CHELA40_11358 [Chelatococcus asaccharovorans]CAH1684923.1 hypothetical protein CHELA17_64242 [Chelatococcus asaccharovorans]
MIRIVKPVAPAAPRQRKVGRTGEDPIHGRKCQDRLDRNLTISRSPNMEMVALHGATPSRDAFGEMTVEHYLRCGRRELEEFDSIVTEWELVRLFERG